MDNYIPPRARRPLIKPPSIIVNARNSALERVLSTFRECLHMPDTGPVEVVLGAYAANRLRGDPVWMLLVGPPSDGKTEILRSLSGLPSLYDAGTLTEAALLSGTKSGERADDAKGGLLKEMEPWPHGPLGATFGILRVKDFTSILSMARETRTSMLGALREIFDGQWTRRVGVDGGRCLSWHGKLGLLGGVTQAIDSHHEVMAAMGPRFVFYRHARVDAQQQARQALANSGHDDEVREGLSAAVTRLFSGIDLSKHESGRSQEETEALVLLAEFVSTCRSAVERDPQKRDITLVFEPESPARLVKVAAQLLTGLEVIGTDSRRRMTLVAKVLKDSIPLTRRKVLDYIMQTDCKSGSILESTGLSKETIRRSLEELKCHDIIVRTPLGWAIAERWKNHLAIAYPGGICTEVKLPRTSAFSDSD